MTSSRLWILIVAGLASPAPAATAAKVAPGPPPTFVSVGMEDPFARPTADAAKSLKAGYKAMQAKKYDEARAAFAAVVAAMPDDSLARMQEVRAAALGGHAADVPALWKELLARDFVAFAGRLDEPKEFAPLRAGPEWAQIKAQEASARSAYAADLGKGIIFIGRNRDLAVGRGRGGIAKLALNQEVYQVDAAGKRYRRLTDTGGQVFAYSIAPGRKAISFLIVATIHEPAGPMPEFVDPSVGAIDLATLKTTGPLRLGPPGTRTDTIVMGWDSQGAPVWTVHQGRAAQRYYTLDATRSATVAVLATGAVPTHRTIAAPSFVSTVSAPPQRVTLPDDRRSLLISDDNRTLRATRVLAPDTVVWGPSGKRLAYAGAFDECYPPARADADPNELFLWERGHPTAARIATAPSAFRVSWLDDDHLVYQSGTRKQSKVHVLEIATGKDSVLKPRAGAALGGFDAIVCPRAARGVGDENVDADTEDADD